MLKFDNSFHAGFFCTCYSGFAPYDLFPIPQTIENGGDATPADAFHLRIFSMFSVLPPPRSSGSRSSPLFTSRRQVR